MLLAIDLGRSPRVLWGWVPEDGESEFSREDLQLMHAAREIQASYSPRGYKFADEMDPEGDPENGYGSFEWQVSTSTNYAVKAIEVARAEADEALTKGEYKDLPEETKRKARAGLIFTVSKAPR